MTREPKPVPRWLLSIFPDLTPGSLAGWRGMLLSLLFSLATLGAWGAFCSVHQRVIFFHHPAGSPEHAADLNLLEFFAWLRLIFPLLALLLAILSRRRCPDGFPLALLAALASFLQLLIII